MKKFFYKISQLLLIALLIITIAAHKKKIFNYSFHSKASKENTQQKKQSGTSFSIKDIQILFQNAKKFEKKDKIFKVHDAKNKILGYAINTSPYTDDIIGYASNVPILIGFSPENKIIGIHLLENAESEDFVKTIRDTGFFESWNGLSATKALEKKVDAVSGATMTSDAVIKGIKKRLAIHKNIEVKQKINTEKIFKKIASALILLFALACFYFKKLKKQRMYLLIASIAVLGFWQSKFISLALIQGWMINGIPFSTQIILAIILLLAVLIPLTSKKAFYCSYICPYGASQELVGKILKKKPKLPNFLKSFLSTLRPRIFMGIVFLLLIGLQFDLTNVEPFSAFAYQAASKAVLILAVLFLILSIFINKPWCQYFCPTGQLLDIFRKSPYKVKKQEKEEMKTNDVISLLLAIAIVILLMRPAEIRKEIQETKITKETASIQEKGKAVKSQEKKTQDTLTIIHQRKSVRHYIDKPVSKELLEVLLKAGMAAPSAANKQPWSFVVVTKRETLNQIADGLTYGKMLKKTGAAIVVCGDLSKALPGKAAEYWIQDCSAVSQNILLAAEASELGAVWLGIYPIQERVDYVKKVLNITSKDIIPLSVISIGHPKGLEKPKNKYKKENIHWEKVVISDDPPKTNTWIRKFS